MNLSQRLKNAGRNAGAAIANKARTARSTVSNAVQGTYAAAARIRRVDIGSIFRPNRADRVAYAAAAIGLSNAIAIHGLEKIVASLQGHPTTAHAAYHLPALAMIAADAVLAAKLDTLVQDARRENQQRHMPPPINASYGRSATLLAFALVAAAHINAATTRISHLLQGDTRPKDEAAIVKETRRTIHSSCAEETIGGQRYASIGCSSLRLNYGADHGYMVSPADPDKGLVVTPFGPRKDPVTGEDNVHHAGIDLLTEKVYAAHRGKVVFVGDTNFPVSVGGKTHMVGSDTCIIIQAYKPEGYAADDKKEAPDLPFVRSMYCCVEPSVKVGNIVKAGTLIARAKSPCTEGTRIRGKEGRPYVHFALLRGDGEAEGYLPINPLVAREP